MNFLNPAPRSHIEHFPLVSIVIPALNEAKYIEQTIKQLLAQQYPEEKLELIVVDGGSTDGTVDLLTSMAQHTNPKFQLLHNPDKRSSISRNMGVKASRNDYILFIDAHVHIPSRTLIADMAEAIMEHQPAVLGRPQPLTAPSLSVFQEATAAVRASFLGHARSSYIYSGHQGWASPLSIGVMYERSLFETFGLFDESFDAAEDLEFNSRLEDQGIRALTSPKFKVLYHPRKSVGQLFHQMHRYGLGRVRFLQKNPHRKRGEVFVPYIAPVLALSIVATSLLFESARTALAYTALLGMLLVIGASVVHLPRTRITSIALLPLCFIVIHLGLSSGVTRGLVCRTDARSHPGAMRTPQKAPERAPS